MATQWKIWRRWLRIIWVTAGLTFTAWLLWNMQAHGVPDDVFDSSPVVVIEGGDQATAFLPTSDDPSRPLVVFLPGGAVDPAAYAPVVRSLAERGWPSVLVRLPWRVAFTAGQRAEVWRRVSAARQRWSPGQPIVLGGHSRGAALSARFAADHPEVLAGLYLVGTTHPRDFSLATLRIPVIKISGDQDCVAPVADSRANQHLLPAQAESVVIEGANHGQFGYYGSQLGDCSATISRFDQQHRLMDILIPWLSRVALVQ